MPDSILQFFEFIAHIDVFLPLLTERYGTMIYMILFAVIFVETGLIVWPFLPGDSLLFVAGSLCALGQMDIQTMAALLTAAAILGDAVNFSVGKYFGEKLFSNPDSKIFRQENLLKTQSFYERHGGKTIVIARFVPIVRTFAPFVAGMGKMRYARFAAYNVAGAAAWVILLSGAGYWFGNNPWVRKNISAVLLGIIVVSMLPMLFGWIASKTGAKGACEKAAGDRRPGARGGAIPRKATRRRGAAQERELRAACARSEEKRLQAVAVPNQDNAGSPPDCARLPK